MKDGQVGLSLIRFTNCADPSSTAKSVSSLKPGSDPHPES